MQNLSITLYDVTDVGRDLRADAESLSEAAVAISLEIQSRLDAIANDAALFDELNFGARASTLDHLDFHILDRIAGLLENSASPRELVHPRTRAERIMHRLESVDAALFRRVRADIRSGHATGAGLRRVIDRYVLSNLTKGDADNNLGYDLLDLFLNGLLLWRALPPETKSVNSEMVFYQQTPARFAIELIDRALVTDNDVFFDVGSGLGQVAILANLLSGASAEGIEIERGFCDYARMTAAELNLTRVGFQNVDARTANYAGGTVFFMYTPFVGSISATVLDRLRIESLTRRIRVATYGPITSQVARLSWLKPLNCDSMCDGLSAFVSV
jgi:hypothetical protein